MLRLRVVRFSPPVESEEVILGAVSTDEGDMVDEDGREKSILDVHQGELRKYVEEVFNCS